MSEPYDREWICTGCGKVESSNPEGYSYDEFVCSACEEAAAQDFINHMAEMTERKQ